MKLAISNLAWSAGDNHRVLEVLASIGVRGIEVAPTRLAPWDALSNKVLSAYKAEILAHDLQVSSLQAIFYGVPAAQLLEDAGGFSAMSEHMDRLADIGCELGAEVAVFGAPNNRRAGELTPEEANSLAIERLWRLGEICRGRIRLGFEPVPEYYGCNFAATADADIKLVNAVDHPNVGLHLDTGCAYLAGDEIYSAIRNGYSKLVHFHAAEPNLSDFSAPVADHLTAGKSLRELGYDRWVSIEMKECGDALAAIVQAVKFVQTVY